MMVILILTVCLLIILVFTVCFVLVYIGISDGASVGVIVGVSVNVSVGVIVGVGVGVLVIVSVGDLVLHGVFVGNLAVGEDSCVVECSRVRYFHEGDTLKEGDSV